MLNRLPQKSLRILGKAILLFMVFNFVFSLVPDSVLWRVSLYNTVLPGKTRLPLEGDLDLLFDAHEIASSAQHVNEYKVVLLGDSSTWGYRLNPDETFASLLNKAGLTSCKGQPIHIYNLGYWEPSIFRDMILLQRGLSYKPNLIIWDVTLLSVFKNREDIQSNPIINDNLAVAQKLVDQYGLANEIGPLNASPQGGQTFLDRKEEIARFIKFQMDGIHWQAIGGELIDKAYAPRGMDVTDRQSFQGANLRPPALAPRYLEFGVINAAIKMAGTTPVLIVNEPIQVVNGKNSDIRYNQVYPRWVYDEYRRLMSAEAGQYHWNYVDLWNLLPPAQFTDSILHRTTKGEQVFAQTMKDIILKNACP